MLPFPIPLNMQIMPPTKNIPSTPSIVKTPEHCRCGEAANLDLFDHLFPRNLGVDNEFIPNAMFDPRFMPLFMVEDFVIAFNPIGPKSNAPKEVPNFNILPYFLGILSSKMTCFQSKQL
jgi:hypothetical protein